MTPPSRPKKKLPWWAIMLIVLGVLMVLGGLAIGGTAWWFISNKDRIVAESAKSVADGKEFAATNEQSSCVREGLRKLDSCSGMICEAQTQIFTTACIQRASRTPGFCDGVPPESEILKASFWVTGECERLGKVGNQRCARLLKVVPKLCHPPTTP